MKKHSDFLGRIFIDPPLDDNERARLSSLGDRRRGWIADRDGCSLWLDGRAPYVEAALGLRHIVAALKRPGGNRRFDGMVVGCRRSNGELFSISARANRVTERTLWPAAGQMRRTRPQPPQAQVIDLASRRAGARGRAAGS